VLSETPINVAGLAAVVTAGIFTLENVYPDLHKEKARISLAIECWLPEEDSYRTICLAPTPEARVVFIAIQQWEAAI